jgi:class 3 adenylate cyclase
VPPERTESKLAAILAADVVGYSQLTGADKEWTLARLKGHRGELIETKITEHRGADRQEHWRRCPDRVSLRRGCGALHRRGAGRYGHP